jgi:hypothetical protein
MIRVVHPGSGILIFLPIPDPGVKKAPDPGSGSAALLMHMQRIRTQPIICKALIYTGILPVVKGIDQ